MSSMVSAADIVNWLVIQIATHERLDPSEIDTRVPFSDYSLGSMAAIRISGDLEQWLGRRLSPTLIYDYPSIESLAHYLAYGTPLQEAVVEVDAHSGAMTEPVAIIGLGCRFPGAANPEAFWQLLSAGEDAISEIPAGRWGAHTFDHLGLEASEKLQASQGGFLDQVDLFDPHFFGISPREAISMDPQQRLLLEVAWETLENAGQAPEQLAGSQTGIFLGISNSDYVRLQSNLPDYIDLYDATGNAFSIAANRLSYLLDVRGPSLVVDTACSSSLVAVHLACQSLRTGEATLALAGGVNMILSPDLTATFVHGQMVASDGHCKTFDASADGYVRSEGCGFVALKLHSNALQDGDQILATIRGSAVNQDGRSNGLTAPNGPAQQAVIRQALRNARVTPDQIGYVEAHGSGTALGDPIEMQALEAVLSERNMEDGFCLVGSVKTNIGHLEAAAGIAGLIKAVLALQHRQIPPHLHLKNLNPRIHFTKNCIAIPTETYAWPQDDRRRRFAGVSSFGLGGTNAHVVLEEAPERVIPVSDEDRPLHVFALSAKSDHALRTLADRYVQFLASHNGQRIQDICFTANVGRSHFTHRFITAVSSPEQLQEKLHTFAVEEKGNTAQTEAVSSGEKPRIAFLYTGQGSQYVGMGYHLYVTQLTFRRAINQCAEILHPFLKVPLLSLLHPRTGTLFLLEQPQYNQPMLFALEYALTQLWKSWGIEPDAVLGHGSGEYAAACSAGVFSLEDGLMLVTERGKLMQALEQQEKMEPIFDAFDQVASSIHFRSPEKPLISSVTGELLQAGAIPDAFYWRQHLSEPVRFSEAIHTLGESGCQIFIELGPRSHLLTLGKQHFPEGFGTWLPSLMPGQDDWQCILKSVGTLYVQGVPIDWKAFDQDYARNRISLPTYPFERQRYWKIAPVEIAQEQLPFPAKPSRYEIILSMLTTIASKPLQIDPAKIDTQALFLEMGVNSLVLLEVMRTVEKTFGVKLEILDFFDDLTTLEALAAYVEQKSSLNVEPIDQPSSLSVPAPVRQAMVSQTALEEEHDELNEKPVSVAALEQIMAKQLEVMAQQLEILQRTSQDIALLMREVKEMRAENLQPDPASSPSPGSGRPQESTSLDEEHQSVDRLVVYSSTVPSQKEENIPEEQEGIVTLPLLDVQKQFWFLSQVGDESSACYERMLELRGPLDVGFMYQAIQQVVDRHEALRTSISADGNVQYIYPHVSFSLPIVDFSQTPAAERSEKVEQWLSEEHQRGFDLTQAPLFRAHILKLAEHIHILVLSVHHIIIDGQSFYVLLQEVSALYSALVSNIVCQLPPAIPFRDYIQSQMQHYQSSQGMANEAYWVEQFAVPLPVLELPIDHARPLVKTYSGARQSIVIETGMLSSLKLLSKEQECTLFMLLLTAYAVLLHRLAGQDDVIVGIPFAGHTLGGDEHLIGSSADIIPIWSCVANNPTFVDALATLKQSLLKAYEHQPYTLASLIQHLKQSGDRSRTLVVSTTFNQNPGISMPAIGKLEARLLATPVWHTVYEISINVVENNRTLEIDFDYNTDLFDTQTLSRIQGYFITLLESIVAQPGQSIADLQILTPVEQKQLLVDWNATTTTYSQDVCVHQLFEQQVRQTPDAIALVFEQEHVTYLQLEQRANRLAQYLHRLEVGSEVMVGVCLENSLEMAVGVLGVLKAGATVVPIDPSAPKERLSFLFADARLTLLLTQSRLSESLPDSQEKTVLLDRDWEVIAQENALQPACEVSAENLVYVIYTSGSTGTPKGVSLPHRVLVNLLIWHRSQLSGGVRTLQFAPLSFDASFHEMFAAWCSGGILCVPDVSRRRDVVGLAHFLATMAIEKAILPVVILQQLAEEYGYQRYEILHLKEMMATGEQLQITRPIVKMFEKLECCTLHNHYGPSESHVVTTYTLPGSTQEWATHPPIGRPIANTQIYVLDASLSPVPIGSVGELYIGGLSLARGYLDRPALTAERFLPHPFVGEGASSQGGARVYKTGDLARYQVDGTIEYLGRRDQQVKIRGYRVELGEIEVALRKLPAVYDVVVVAREMQGEKRLVAYVVGSERITTREVRVSLQNKLPEYMIPAYVVLLESVPLTPNGKVDCKGLPDPREAQEDGLEASQDARTPLEELLQEVWREVLGRHQVGVHENFFEVGGHSLLATQLIARFRTLFAVEVPVRMIFEHPTIAEVAQQIEQAMHRDAARPMPPLSVAERPREIPLSFAQQRLWFLDQLEPGSTAYLLPGILRVSGEVNAKGLEWVMQELIQRHESLRTIFVEQSGEPMQVILPAGSYLLPVIDLQGLGYEQSETHASWLTRQESLHSYDLAKGPLVRTALLRLDSTTHILLLTLHHIITDAWSNGILMQDFTLLYQAAMRGEPSPLAPLSIQYADYTLWQRQWLQAEELEAQLAYWSMQLAGVAPLELPTDHPRPAVQMHRGVRARFLFSHILSEQLVALSRQHNVTLFMLLVASFQVLLARYTEQYDISVGTPIANRRHAELEGVVGFFLNTLVLRTDLSGDPTFEEVLHRVREVCLNAYAHQDIPFEKVVEELAPERDMSRSPFFQVLMVLQNTPSVQFELGEGHITLEAGETIVSHFDLTLFLTEMEQGLECILEYDTELFEAETIERLLGHWQTLLEGVVHNPQVHVSATSLLTSEERERLLGEWNGTQREYPPNLYMHQLFEQQVQCTPDALAVVSEQVSLTYRELNRQANQLAHHLQRIGVGPETLVGVCMERSPEVVIVLLALLKVGGVYVPLDPSYPAERLTLITEDAQFLLILTQDSVASGLLWASVPLLCVDTERFQWCNESDNNLEHGVVAKQLAYIIYTSGSTGRPKGAMIEQQGMLNHLFTKIQDLTLTHGDRVAQTASLSFDISVWQLLSALLVGGCTVIYDREVVSDPVRLIECLQIDQISIVELVPTFLQALLESVESRSQRERSLPYVRWVVPTGEALSPVLCRRWFAIYPETPLLNAYGPTECSDDVASYALMQSPDPLTLQVPIGRPVSNLRLYVLDPRQLQVPIGITGELFVGGVGVGRGYLNDPPRTAAIYVPDPFADEPGQRLYKTGDRVRFQRDGTLEFLGRIDQQVKIRGFRIELGEIEAMLGQHPAVRECVVLAQDDPFQNKRLVAYVVPHLSLQQGDLTPALLAPLRQYLQERLPEYLIPAVFVPLSVLPLNANGKVDRRALLAPEVVEGEGQQTQQGARTALEELLLDLWCEVLGRRQIGIHDNFFELGGHSLLATRLIARIKAMLGIEMPLRAVFETPTVESLAHGVEQSLQKGGAIQMPPLVAGVRPEKLPLSFAQQRIWFLDQLNPGSTAYLLPSAFNVSGEIDVRSLERALEEMLRRHESLRTIFVEKDGRPVQMIGAAGSSSLPVIDLSRLGYKQAEVHMRWLAHQNAQHSYDLTKGPLLRIVLLRLDDTAHILLFMLHHIITDAWSNAVLVQELTVLYQSIVAGESSPLAPLPIQYADYALWQQQWLQGEVLAAQIAYWRTQLAAVAPLVLPTDHPRSAVQTHRGTAMLFQFSPMLSDQLVVLSQQQHVTLFILLLATFQMLLARYSGQRDISVGSPIANRRHVDLEGVIGFFANTLVFRTDLSGDPTFVQVLQRVREVCLGAYAHQDIPFEKVVQELSPERDLSHSPLFQVLFVLQNVLQRQAELAGMSIKPLVLESSISKFDLTLSIEETGEGLSGMLEYNTDLFEVETITRMLSHWQTLLEGIVHNHQVSLSEVALLTQEERELLLVRWNATQTAYVQQGCVYELFEQQVQQTPETVALVFEEQQLTYDQLNGRANQLAHHLQTLGVGPEVLVGICMERSVEMVIGLLGVLKVGGAYVPLDPSYPEDRVAYMLEDCQPAVVLTQAHLRSHLSFSETLSLDIEWEEWIGGCLSSNPGKKLAADQLAYLIYTSGSTGRPKGVMNTHRGLRNRLLWMQQAYSLTQRDRVLQKTPFSFDVSVWEFFWPLVTGACLVVAIPRGHQDPTYLKKVLVEQQITTLHFVPAMLQTFLQEPGVEACRSVRQVISSGEALTAELQTRFFTHFSAEVGLHNLYGPTEASIDVTFWVCKLEREALVVPIGYPIANIQIHLLDKSMRPVPIGVEGELYIGGVGLARGYNGRADLTAEKFVANPFARQGSERLYKTGDLARYRNDGAIEYLGRIDQQVKLRGFRIELGEIEAVLQAHPAVEEGVVLAREDVPGNKRLVAYVVMRPGQELSQEELRTNLQARLPSYMIPSAFVFLEALPLTSNGKVDRKVLPSPEMAKGENQHGQQEARTPQEELLLSLWREVLDRRQVGIHENFFELGGHSLLATRLMARVRAVLGVEVPLLALFEAPTVAEFVPWIEHAFHESEALQMPPLAVGVRPEQLPLSFAQQRLWFLDQLEPNNTAYLLPGAFSVRGEIDVQSLGRALEDLIERHESLRTVFDQRDGKPVQVVQPIGPSLFPIIDLQGLGHERAGEYAHLLMSQEAQHPCDLSKGPLLRVLLLRLECHEHILLMTLHHIITDGWSNSVLMREFTMLYRAIVAGRPSPLATLPVQYADYALWQRDWLQGEVLDSQLAYWRTQLAGEIPLELPIDHLRPAVQSSRGAGQVFQLSTALLEQLVVLSRQQNVTLFMLLLASMQVLLAQYSGQHDISVGTPIANRRHADLEGVVGFFLNTLVLRTDLSGDPTFEQVLYRVRRVCLEAYAHQDIPFEKIVEELAPERDLSRTPLFQVLFVLQNTPPGELKLGEASIKPLAGEIIASSFDLAFFLTETEQGLDCSLDYNPDLFEAETIVWLLDHWQNLLQGVVCNSQVHLSEVLLLTQDEQTRILVDWNATQRAYPQDWYMHQLFEQQVEHTPDALAVVCEDVGLTYQELNRRANQLAHHLQHLGVGPETLVGVCMERSPELLIALLALFKAGGVYVPLDPSDPAERLAWIGEDAQFLLILIQERVVTMLPWTHIPFLYIDTECHWWSDEHSSNPGNRLTMQNLAYVIYTSGSTGRPKGAMIEQQGMLNHLFSKIEDVTMTSADRVAQTASLSFDISVWQLLSALLVGGCTVIYDREVVSDPPRFMECLRTDQISIVELVPTFLQALLESVEPWAQHERSLPYVRWVVPTGEALSPALGRRWFAVYPEIPLLNAYGPTECSDDVASYALIQAPDPQALQVPIGHPVGNMRLYVLDAHQRVLPIGIAGELFVGGVGVGRGYLNDAQRTAAIYVPDPFAEEPGQRLYKTGDRARPRRDGELEFLGRMDQQVKIRGYRIELGEIEAVLREHEAIREAVVLVREEATGEKRLIAYVVLWSGERPSEKAVRTFLQDRLPSYMLPWTCVFLDALPLTPNGKIDRRTLPAPEGIEEERSSTEQEARTPMEELLLSLWREVLGRQQIGIYDNFFELGGYSLLAMQLIVRIRAMLTVEVPLRIIFEEPTIASFALWIEQVQRKDKGMQVPPLLAGVRPEEIPLSFAQQRLWFLDQLNPGSTAYLDPNVLRVRGKIDRYALDRALVELVHRHESLRTTFAQRVGPPRQIIHPASPLQFPVIDLQGLEYEQAEVHASRLVHQEAQCPCDLTRGPLIRIALLWLARHEHVLLLTLHHIITDGLSTRVLVNELTTLYEAVVAEQPSPLAPLPIQYADYALWQRQWLQGEVLQQHIEYWRKQLWRARALELPIDASSSAVRTQRGASYSFTLSTELLEKLLRLSRQESVTLFMLLLAAFQVFLYRATNQDDIVIGTDVANRNHIETEGLIGFFVNQLVLRSHLAGYQTFRELLYQVRNMTMDAYLHQDIPFEKLVEVLRPERKGQATPYFLVKMLLESIATEGSLSQEGLNLLDIKLDSLALSGEMAIDLDLILRFLQTSDGIQGAFDYRADLFEQATIERMASNFLVLLERICMNPDERLDAFEAFTQPGKKKTRTQRKERGAMVSTQLKNIRPQSVILHEEEG